MKKIYTLLVLALLITNAKAQTATGKINKIETKNKAPLSCTGSDIYGQVTFSGGNVTSGKVCLYIDSSIYRWDTLAVSNLDATGNYHFTNIRNGNYVIEAFADTLIYPHTVLPSYYNPTSGVTSVFWDSANVVNISNCLIVDTFNIRLREATFTTGHGQIEGRITEGVGFSRNTGDPIPNVDVKIGYCPGGEPGVWYNSFSSAYNPVNAGGYYYFNNLPVGCYKIYVDMPGFQKDSSYSVCITPTDTSFINLDYLVDSVSIHNRYPLSSVTNTNVPCSFTSTKGSCSANFSMYADTIPHHYIAVNNATGAQPLTYLWSWGDGTSDNIAYPSHTYASAGYYTISLTITDNTACTSTYYSSYNILAPLSPMIYVNVIAPATVGIPVNTKDESISLYPNPTSASFTIASTENKIKEIKVFNVLGEEVFQSEPNNNQSTINSNQFAKGIYFVQIQTEKGVENRKVVVQ